MNIWIFNHYALPPGASGGTRHHTLARYLQDYGHRVVIIASGYNHWRRREEHLAAGENWRQSTVDGVPFIWLRTPAYGGNRSRMWNMAIYGLRAWRGSWLSATGERPDIILGSTPHLFATLAAQRLACRFRVPFLLEVRDIWPQSLVDLAGLSPRHPVIRLFAALEGYLYRRADRVLSLLPAAAPYLVSRGAAPGKIVWLPNGTDLAKIPVAADQPPAAVFTVVYAGAHGRANDLDMVLAAAGILEAEGWGDKIRFLLVGDGPEKARLQRQAAAASLRMVTFRDPVPKDEVFAILQQADACLLLLKDSPVFRWGISPNKLFDYLAASRPVLFGVNTPENPVEKTGAGLSFAPADPGALAAAVRKMFLMTPEERRQMGMNGRRYLEEHHDMRWLAGRLAEVMADYA